MLHDFFGRPWCVIIIWTLLIFGLYWHCVLGVCMQVYTFRDEPVGCALVYISLFDFLWCVTGLMGLL